MDDNPSHIKQDPPRIRGSLTVMGDNTFVLKRFTDFLLNSLYLAVAITTANNKIIGKGAYLSGIQHNDTIGLFI